MLSLILIFGFYLSVASKIVKLWKPHWANRCAADNPAIPAPMIIILGSGLHGSITHGFNWHVSNFVDFVHFDISFLLPSPLSDENNLQRKIFL